jgi:cytochrome c oxidase subunit 2
MLPLFADRSFWLETPASNTAQNHDFVFYILLYVMAFFFFLVMAIMLAFVVIYRQKKGQAFDRGPTHNTPLELSWTIVPLVIVLGFFVLGLRYFVDLESPPDGAMVVDVEASQWHFNFKYPNGAEADDLYLLADRPVLLRLTSKDVTHALYIPVFRVQRNAVPGRTTQLWFVPTEKTTGKDPETGDDAYYHIFCTQYCGNGHSEMQAKCYVLDKAEYDKKLSEAANIFVDHAHNNAPLPYAKVGEKLYAGNCAQCHTINGGASTGPTWKGLYKSNVKFSVPAAGYTLSEADDDAKWDDYLVDSILHPEAKIVEGYQNVMPSQESAFSDTPGSKPNLAQIKARILANKDTTYKEKKLVAITEYIKSVGNSYKEMETPKAAPPSKSEAPTSSPKSESPASESKPAASATGPASQPKSTSPSKSKEEGK